MSTTSPLFSLAKFGPQLTDVQTIIKVSGQVYVHFLSHFCIMIKTEFIIQHSTYYLISPQEGSWLKTCPRVKLLSWVLVFEYLLARYLVFMLIVVNNLVKCCSMTFEQGHFENNLLCLP